VKNDNTYPTPPGSGIFHVTPVDDKQHAQQQVTNRFLLHFQTQSDDGVQPFIRSVKYTRMKCSAYDGRLV